MRAKSSLSTFQLACMAATSLLVSGCFLAENDLEDPIIPDESLAYPIAFGAGQECSGVAGGEQTCQEVKFEQAEEGGYLVTEWAVGENPGDELVPTTSKYRLRLLTGGNIPPGTYLAQSGDAGIAERYLGLLMSDPEGGWVKVSPQCDHMGSRSFVRFITQGWITTDEGAALANMTCVITRAGLDDARLFAILDSARESGTRETFFGPD